MKISSYTPPWLSRPAPGAEIFGGAQENVSQKLTRGFQVPEEDTYNGPNRCIATRGTEVFVVIDKQIRWADLPTLKDQWQAEEMRSGAEMSGLGAKSDDDVDLADNVASYRVLRVSIGEPIRQLIMSPNQQMMAIVTSHTVHIAILPASELLGSTADRSVIKLKTHTIGPTTHILSQSSVASVLWHPLGPAGNTLVTVTSDAVVRLWEFDSTNRWSADSTALAIDLKKLATANCETDGIEPNRSSRNKAYTTDAVGMDVASACFGSRGDAGDCAWAAMTLWIAMRDGDVYALCPLLPSTWQPCGRMVSSLAVKIAAKENSRLRSDEAAWERQLRDQQLAWIRDIDSQEPMMIPEHQQGIGNDAAILKRPSRPGGIPRLQGPFTLLPEPDEDLELSDIFVISPTEWAIDEAEQLSDCDSDDEDDSADELHLSIPLICLLTVDARVYITMALDGVDGQWLPRKSPRGTVLPDASEPSLTIFEALETMRIGEPCLTEWPSFSLDRADRYNFFVTHTRGVYAISVEPWLGMLEHEISHGEPTGSEFRLKSFRESAESSRDRILAFDAHYDADVELSLPACVVMQDSDLGHFLLTSFDSQARCAVITASQTTSVMPLSMNNNHAALFENHQPAMEESVLDLQIPARAAYMPSSAFYESIDLFGQIRPSVSARHQQLLSQEIRLSISTLDMMTEAHRILSRETHRLGLAASELFSRCHSLQQDLRHQVERAAEIVQRTEGITQVAAERSNDKTNESERWQDDESPTTRYGKTLSNQCTKEELISRADRARRRQEQMTDRVNKLKHQVKGLEGRLLSWREREWKREIEDLSAGFIADEIDQGRGNGGKLETNLDADQSSEQFTGQEKSQDRSESLGATNEQKNGAPSTASEHTRRYQEVQTLKVDVLARIEKLNDSTEASDEAKSTTNEDSNRDIATAQLSNARDIPTNVRRQRIESVKQMLDYESFLVEAAQAKLEVLNLSSLPA